MWSIGAGSGGDGCTCPTRSDPVQAEEPSARPYVWMGPKLHGAFKDPAARSLSFLFPSFKPLKWIENINIITVITQENQQNPAPAAQSPTFVFGQFLWPRWICVEKLKVCVEVCPLARAAFPASSLSRRSPGCPGLSLPSLPSFCALLACFCVRAAQIVARVELFLGFTISFRCCSC